MKMLPLRLRPGDDLRAALEQAVAGLSCTAAFVLSGIGSLERATLRLAGATQVLTLDEDLEILSLAGTIAANGSHLHLAIAGADGRVLGGHAAAGCRVRTTAEILVALLPDAHFERTPDPATGYAELTIRAAGEQ